MDATAPSFYVTGGTLRPDAPSYVERQADRDLYDGLSRGDFCYVLTARQMGKSSLMARTARRLGEAGVTVAVLDLTAIGQNLSPEQWYDGLRWLLGQQLDLDDELDDFWLAQERLGPLQRWLAALQQVVLARVPGRIVIFVEEVDTVLSLPFSTDEFFAGIRECYNRRAQDPAFDRLAFCLLGVAAPSDLIRDTRTTPFNIGRRIELTDFTEAEAGPLAQGMGRREAVGLVLLKRVLYWTDGHPYLTQRLCQAVAQDTRVVGPVGVDRLCTELFLSVQARERDDNLLFVRDRLLRSEADVASLLDLYTQVWRRQRVPADEANPLVTHLRLSGATRVVAGHLSVHNRIYAQVFDRHWVTEHMPDAELRRQRAAYRRGLLRATAVAGVILAVIGGLALTAIRQARRADQQALRADRMARQEAQQRRLAEERERMGHRYLYAAQMKLAQQAWEAGNVGGTLDLLKAQRPVAGQEDLRGFEWRYLWRLCQGDQRFILRGDGEPIVPVAFSPDGKLLASGAMKWDQPDRPGDVTVWRVSSRQKSARLRGHKGAVISLAFSPDGSTLASGSLDRTVKLWNIATKRELATLQGHTRWVYSVAFSPDGKTLASGSWDATARLWDVTPRLRASNRRREIATLRGHDGAVQPVAFSPDGRLLATGGRDNTVKLWDLATRREVTTFTEHTGHVESVVFSPDGRLLASAGQDNRVKLWDVSTHRALATLSQTGMIGCVRFSPHGELLATGCNDTTIKLWDVRTRQPMTTLRGHRSMVDSVAFSPNGKTLASGSQDGTVRLWDVAPKRDRDVLYTHPYGVSEVALSPDGKTVASSLFGAPGGGVKLWDAATGGEMASLPGMSSLAFSTDGKTLAGDTGENRIKLWDVTPPLRAGARRREIATLAGAFGPLAFSPDGRLLASSARENRVKLWDIRTRRVTATLKGHRGPIRSLAFSPNGRMLATGTDERSPHRPDEVKLWDVISRREIATIKEHPFFKDLAFSPDNKILATGSFDRNVKLWDVATRRHLATLKGHTGVIWGVAFSPDGKTLASGGEEGTVKLWNVASGQEVVTLQGHTAPITGVAFSPDGAILVSSSTDKTVRLWRAANFAETDASDRPRGRRASR